MGAYSYAATLLPQELSVAIDDFRAKFAATADQLMWEFGPSERGHALVITSEWHDELRPVALAVVARAPDLPRWRFFDARTAKTLEKVVPLPEARRGKPMTIATMDVRLGSARTVDLSVSGTDAEGELRDQAMVLFSLLFGEEIDRIWLGHVEVTRPRRGFAIFGRKGPMLDLAAVHAKALAVIAQAKDMTPDAACAGANTESRPITLLSAARPGDGPKPRQDLTVMSSAYPELANARLSGGRFASQRFSRFREAFVSVKIAREGGRDDETCARHELEDAVHHELGDAGGTPTCGRTKARMDPVRRRRVAGYCAGHLARDTDLSLNPLEVACKQHSPQIS